MSVLEALILGIVQGLTEFLPISSSGHLVLFQKLFGLDKGLSEIVTFDIAVHFATLIAVFVVLWKDVVSIIKNPFGKMTWLIVVGTIPAVVIGFAFKDFFEELLKSGVTLGFEFIFTGLILWYAESINSNKNLNKKLEGTTYPDALIVGFAQAIAILPAVSRSGATLAGSLFRGMNREFALRFSFLLSIPAILGPALLESVDMFKGNAAGVEILPLVVGMIAAAVSGYLAVKFMLKVFTKSSLKPFSVYVFILGGLIILDQFVFKIFF